MPMLKKVVKNVVISLKRALQRMLLEEKISWSKPMLKKVVTNVALSMKGLSAENVGGRKN